MSLKFSRRIEDFTCGNCGTAVTGTGYTNHCPHCLYSRHVDVYPGDRSAGCGSLMQPVKVEVEKNEYLITHKCLKCGVEKRNKTQKEDNLEIILRLIGS